MGARLSNRAASSSQPATSAAIAPRGGSSHSRVPGRTGHTASSPFSGSRIMPLAKDERRRWACPAAR